MSSVERIQAYSEIENEAAFIVENNRPPKDWPSKGAVEFDNVIMRYRKELDPVLKGVSFTLDGGLKCGIVGRTGSGKSSLMVSLFRLTEMSEGGIYIDGLNIRDMGLGDLRGNLSIIPQDPVLFSGSLRFNLDPFQQYTDPELWQALRYVKLDDYIVASGDQGLDTEISEAGSNFSVGQRQLICMARALLRKSKVLVMDEATASVDVETDALIQRAVRFAFKDCTVLTIAHRLNTIMDSDRVLVMEDGRVGEFGHPAQLLENPNGLLSAMVQKTGAQSAAHLRRVARGEVELYDAKSFEQDLQRPLVAPPSTKATSDFPSDLIDALSVEIPQPPAVKK